jgi:hypothetical protein
VCPQYVPKRRTLSGLLLRDAVEIDQRVMSALPEDEIDGPVNGSARGFAAQDIVVS